MLLQADAFKDENSKRRTLEKQMDALCQQVGGMGGDGPKRTSVHTSDMCCRAHGLHEMHAVFMHWPCTLSLHVAKLVCLYELACGRLGHHI